MALLDITPDEYHQLPGFSASLAKELIARSPLHARHLDLHRGSKPSTKAMELGDVGHILLLGKGKRIEVVEADDWRTKDAKAIREAAHASGRVPILASKLKDAIKMVDTVRQRLHEEHQRDARVPDALDGISERAMTWTVETYGGDVECRGMMDHYWPATGEIIDLKFVGDASPSAVERSAESMGHAIQRAAYAQGLESNAPHLAGRVRFRFLFIETIEPYAINLVEPDGVFRELGERRWSRAVESWGRCMAAGVWPGYAGGTITSPAWAINREVLADEPGARTW